MSFHFPKALFMVGDPTEAPPYRDATVIERFVKENPDWAIVVIVDNEEERQKVGEKLKKIKFPQFHPGGLVAPWNNDAEMMDLLIADMHFLETWAIVSPAWYTCENKHESASTLKEPLTKCPECKSEKLEFHKLNEDKHERFKDIVKNANHLVRFDTRSGQALSQMVNSTGNVLKNMPYVLGLPEAPALKLEDYKLKGKGKPAICIAAGPSVRHNLADVRRLQEEAVVIAVGRSFKWLRAEGIRVDYVFSCEMFDWDSVIFDGVTPEIAGDAILCYPPVCAPATVLKWPGKRLCTIDPNTAELVGAPLAMMGGNSVAHHMLNFACEILGCEPTILVGYDFGYTDPGEQTHPEETKHPWPDVVKHEDDNYQNEAWDECATSKGPFTPSNHRQRVWLKGGFAPVGPPVVRTSPSYKCFRDLTNILIRRHGLKVWSACPNGLKIHEAPYLDLSTVESLAALAGTENAALR